MFDKYFYIWSVVPFALLMLGLWGWIKSFSDTRSQEPVFFYFKQFIFCFVLLLLSIPIINSSFFNNIQDYMSWILPKGFLAWMVYPVLLLIGAKLVPGEKPPEDPRLKRK